MKNNLSHLFSIIIISGLVISISSCYVYSDPYIVDVNRQKRDLYYIASAPNAPFLTEKNEISFNGVVETGSFFTGGAFQAAFMANENIGVTGSFAAGEKYNRFELGAGYVTSLRKNWHFETYAGFGSGRINNRHHTGTSKINLTHFFIQPAFLVHNETQTTQFGFVSRFEGVNFKVIDTSYSSDRELYTTAQIKSLYAEPFHLMWQPGVVLRAGWKSFLFHTGYSYSVDLTNSDLNSGSGNFTAGFSFRLTGKREEKNKIK